MEQAQRLAFILVSFPKGSRSFLEVVTLFGKYESSLLGSISVHFTDSEESAFGVLVKANTDQIGAITGFLGKLSGVKVKSALLPEK